MAVATEILVGVFFIGLEQPVGFNRYRPGLRHSMHCGIEQVYEAIDSFTTTA